VAQWDQLDRQMVRLVAAVRSVQRQTGEIWVSCRQVAKAMEGSEEYEAYIAPLAQSPEGSRLFRLSDNETAIALTDSGIAASMAPISVTLSLPEQIAEAVKRYASRIRRQRLRVLNVGFIGRTERHFVQALAVETLDQVIPLETPVEFFSEEDRSCRTHGRVVGREPGGSVLYLAFDHRVYDWHLPGVLYLDRAFLLHQLADCLDAMPDVPPLANPLLEPACGGLYINSEDSGKVGDMIPFLKVPWTRFLWGPPGSGKTYGIARAIVKLLSGNTDERILLLAPSNLAVDNAVAEVVDRLSDAGRTDILDRRQVLRYGYPRSHRVLGCRAILGSSAQDRLSNEVERLAVNLHAAQKGGATDSEVAMIQANLLGAQEALKNAVIQHVSEARVVATTTTMAYLKSSPVRDQTWHSVFVDEVTMVPPAMCFYLSSLAQKRLLLAGDPRQLGPVFIESQGRHHEGEDALHWMGRDIFEVGGVSEGEGEQRRVVTEDPRMVRINSQRRCAPAIWGQVAHLYPEVRNLSRSEKTQPLAMLPPLPGKSVVLVDVDLVADKALPRQEHRSWCNTYTADLSVSLATQMLDADGSGSATAAVITPYRAQVSEVRKRLRELQVQRGASFVERIEAGTIHQFQGSEADIVIFDIVDRAPRRGPGILLRGDTGIRLVNVAATRARGKLLVIADRTWCSRHMDQADNPLLWHLVVERKIGEVIKAQDCGVPLPV
jgi:hypothetical protein